MSTWIILLSIVDLKVLRLRLISINGPNFSWNQRI